jgi:4-hydroxybenzoate polyprenyltransferase
MMSEGKKRRIKLSALFGGISGAALAAILYFMAGNNLFYFILVPIAAGMGAAQAYMTPESSE